MPTPFPGMDPYLEDTKLWPMFHRELIASLNRSLLSGLTDRYRTQIVERDYSATDSSFASAEQQSHQEQYIEVREGSDARLVTMVDVVSPANKTTQSGRLAYLETRRAGRDAGANLVEIDLVLQGPPTLDYSRDGLPEWDYAVTVTRAQPERYEIYTATLQKRLPRFRLPLAGDSRDTVIDLTSIFSQAFERGGFASMIDYKGEPPTAVTATLAYRLWEREGRPHGKDKDQWFRAIAEIKRPTTGDMHKA